MSDASSPSPQLILVEDDVGLAELICQRLEAEGFEVTHEVDGRTACRTILERHPDLVILDLMLPGMDGFQVCREVRPEYGGPILILTARDDDLDEILGLELGADDFVTKPVKPRVLLARIRALLRRANPAPPEPRQPSAIRLAALEVDPGRREVTLDGRVVALTTVEFDLLWYLARHAGKVVSRQELFQDLFHYDYDGLDRSVDVYVSRLRQKLRDDPAHPRLIKTVRGVGYLLAAERA